MGLRFVRIAAQTHCAPSKVLRVLVLVGVLGGQFLGVGCLENAGRVNHAAFGERTVPLRVHGRQVIVHVLLPLQQLPAVRLWEAQLDRNRRRVLGRLQSKKQRRRAVRHCRMPFHGEGSSRWLKGGGM